MSEATRPKNGAATRISAVHVHTHTHESSSTASGDDAHYTQTHVDAHTPHARAHGMSPRSGSKFSEHTNQKNAHGESPLHLIVRKRHAQATQLMLAHGAQVNALNSSGRAPLHALFETEAHTNTHVPSGEGDEGARESECNDAQACAKGCTTVCECEAIQVLNLLLRNGAHVNVCDEDGNTPLHLAAATGHAQCVRELLNHGAKVHTNANGELPLHCAAAHAHMNVIALLLDDSLVAVATETHCTTHTREHTVAAPEEHVEQSVSKGSDDDAPTATNSHTPPHINEDGEGGNQGDRQTKAHPATVTEESNTEVRELIGVDIEAQTTHEPGSTSSHALPAPLKCVMKSLYTSAVGGGSSDLQADTHTTHALSLLQSRTPVHSDAERDDEVCGYLSYSSDSTYGDNEHHAAAHHRGRMHTHNSPGTTATALHRTALAEVHTRGSTHALPDTVGDETRPPTRAQEDDGPPVAMAGHSGEDESDETHPQLSMVSAVDSERDEWMMYETEDGDTYYYNAHTNMSQWDPPPHMGTVTQPPSQEALSSSVVDGNEVQPHEHAHIAPGARDEASDPNAEYQCAATSDIAEELSALSLQEAAPDRSRHSCTEGYSQDTDGDQEEETQDEASTTQFPSLDVESEKNARSLEIWNKFFENAIMSRTGEVSHSSSSTSSSASASSPSPRMLFDSVINGDLTGCEQLVMNGCDVMCLDAQNRTPLHYASYNGDVDMAALLCDLDADIDAQDSEGNTPLHVCAAKGSTRVCIYLLEYAAQVDVQNGGGDTPLHLACWFGHHQCVSHILSYADVAITFIENVHGLDAKGNVLARSPVALSSQRKKRALPTDLQNCLKLVDTFRRQHSTPSPPPSQLQQQQQQQQQVFSPGTPPPPTFMTAAPPNQTVPASYGLGQAHTQPTPHSDLPEESSMVGSGSARAVSQAHEGAENARNGDEFHDADDEFHDSESTEEPHSPLPLPLHNKSPTIPFHRESGACDAVRPVDQPPQDLLQLMAERERSQPRAGPLYHVSGAMGGGGPPTPHTHIAPGYSGGGAPPHPPMSSSQSRRYGPGPPPAATVSPEVARDLELARARSIKHTQREHR